MPLGVQEVVGAGVVLDEEVVGAGVVLDEEVVGAAVVVDDEENERGMRSVMVLANKEGRCKILLLR